MDLEKLSASMGAEQYFERENANFFLLCSWPMSLTEILEVLGELHAIRFMYILDLFPPWLVKAIKNILAPLHVCLREVSLFSDFSKA